ncbi:DUF983 domain-containing protein [Paradevosia shaoguanensis]|uniref:DUF983 domain-containing protein n=1 Tax=Paradevosia shaoguanensis TaxID=1335043 RepID=A0AA41UF50_9HYPH|nr:DUF983 domain-containing protein [Paradevosia shaoguanensis]KFL27656.1 membrane protein [Devosia sp. 17-2-E-8]MCF1741633.1 DUF983 domain-containing protein [Paradevosia shaoguanensis]MCI0126116.1 DUF983 domain-containing protein [Paradevosia shaoguanensis]
MSETIEQVNPFKVGILCRCPRCGQGKLFKGYLKVAPACTVCGLDFAFADSGDGPAIFIIFVVGFLVMGMALIVDIIFHPPVFVHLALWVPATLILCFALLPPFKATLVALQFRHDAHEGRRL